MIFVAACKSPPILPSKTPIKDRPIKELTKAISKNGADFKKFRSRVKTTYYDGKRSQQVIVNLRMEKDKSIWMSANILVPIAKILITPKKSILLRKISKNLFSRRYYFY
jgi:5-enolpyruvylshikimate-3-phosphate synthase